MTRTLETNPTIFLTEKDLAERHQRSVKAVQYQRITGGGVPFVKFGRSVRYRLADVEAWEEAHLRVSTSDNGGAKR
jgi:predicted DNA-binding transcriptional regulator AlpA